MNSSLEWLAALLAAVLPEILTGIKIPTNPADCLQAILATNGQSIGIGSTSGRTEVAAKLTYDGAA
jgi:hypothetical protein